MSKSERIPIDRGVVAYRHGATWWLDIHQNGRRVRRNLGTADKRRAMVIAREVASEIAARLWNVAAASELTVASAVEKYRASIAWSNLSRGTQSNTERTLCAFEKCLAGQGLLRLDRIQRSHLEAFAQWKAAQPHPKTKKPISPVTVNQWLSRLCALFGWLQREGFVRFNPASRVRLKVRPPQVKPILLPEQVFALAEACPETLRDLVVVLSETALRISEAVELKGSDVDVEQKSLAVMNTKANRYDFIPLNANALTVLLRRKLASGTEGYIFTCSNGGPLDRRNVRRDLIAIGEKVGIRISGPHMLRRSCLTNAANTLTPSQLAQLGRHRDPRTTAQHYVGKLDFVPPTMVRNPREPSDNGSGGRTETSSS